MKKTIAIMAGVIPAVSAVIAIFLMVSHFEIRKCGMDFMLITGMQGGITDDNDWDNH